MGEGTGLKKSKRKKSGKRDRPKQTGLKALGAVQRDPQGGGYRRSTREWERRKGATEGLKSVIWGWGALAAKGGWRSRKSPRQRARGRPLAADLPVTCNKCHERASRQCRIQGRVSSSEKTATVCGAAGPTHPPRRRKKLQLSLERGGAGLLKGPHNAPGSSVGDPRSLKVSQSLKTLEECLPGVGKRAQRLDLKLAELPPPNYFHLWSLLDGNITYLSSLQLRPKFSNCPVLLRE